MPPTGTTVSATPGLKWIRCLVVLNLGLVAVQALSAGFVLSGSGPAAMIHARVALLLEAGALIQAVVTLVLWRRRRAPAWVARAGIVLFAIVVLQSGLGRSRRYWLHVPIGVGLFGGLIRQTSQLGSLSRATERGRDGGFSSPSAVHATAERVNK